MGHQPPTDQSVRVQLLPPLLSSAACSGMCRSCLGQRWELCPYTCWLIMQGFSSEVIVFPQVKCQRKYKENDSRSATWQKQDVLSSRPVVTGVENKGASCGFTVQGSSSG